MLKITNCTKKFKKLKALDNFSMDFDNGVYGLLGPNGAGKTTLIRCICGLYKTDGGTIDINSKTIGYLPQKFGMFKDLSVYEMMEYFATLKKIDKEEQKSAIEECIEKVNLTEKIKSPVGTLSGGMVRRLGIAQAILGNPDIIIFDEPTAGLDPEERMRFKNIIGNIKKDNTIIISTHIVTDVEAICDNIVVMNKGKVASLGTGIEIASLAENKVYLVNAENEKDLKGDFFVKDRLEKDGERILRVLSSEKQPGKLITSTVEDGFIWTIKNS